MAPPLIPLARCGIGDAAVIGREAAVLGQLLSAGVAVPDGVVLLPAAGELSDAALLREVSDLMGTGRHLVRASAVRDPGGAPEATLLDVETEAVVAAIRNCWASAEGMRPGCAVLVQRRVAATAAGTANADAASGEPPSVLVSAAPAHGRLPTADHVSPDEWVVRDGVATCRRSAHDAVDAATVVAVADLLRCVERHLGGPQDVEWASEEGRVVLLRARHGGIPPEQIAVPIDVPEGFWERDASHSPKPWTPMLGSVFFDIRDAALRELFATFGLLAQTLEFRQIGGREYTRLVPLGGKDRPPPPASLMPLLARIVPAMRKRIRTCVEAVRGDVAGAMVDRWYAEWQPDLAARAAALRAQEVSALDDEALAAHTDLALALLHDGSRRHFLLQGAFGFPVAELVFTAEELLGWPEERTFRLLAGLSVTSTRPAHRLAEIARRARGRPELRSLLDAGVPTLDAVRAVAPEIADELDAHIAEFGQRTLSFDIADPSIAEQPALTQRVLVSLARRGYDPAAEASALATARAEATADAHALLADRPAAFRERFDRVLARAQRAYPLREDNEFPTFGVPMAVLRRAVLEHGTRLAIREVLARRDDVFWLTLRQAAEALRATSPHAPTVSAAGVPAEATRSVAPALADAAGVRAEVTRSVARAKGNAHGLSDIPRRRATGVDPLPHRRSTRCHPRPGSPCAP